MILEEKLYKPGEKLPTENELSLQFKVSRPVIREAIKALVAQGVLETRRGTGTFVTDHPGFSSDPLGLADISDRTTLLKDWYETRKAVESEAIRMVVSNATIEDITELRKCVEETELAIFYGDSEFLKSDRKFHITLARLTHNNVMERLVTVLMHSFYYNMTDMLNQDWVKSAMENSKFHHNRILQSIIERDTDGAVLAIRSHMFQAMSDLEIGK